MRARLILLLSMLLNIVLILIFVVGTRDLGPTIIQPVATPKFSRTPLERSTNPAVVIRRQFFHWNEVESSDFNVYINNLRSIGCPAETIRDLIIAEVDELFAKRRAKESIVPDPQWWRSEPDPKELLDALAREQAISREQNEMLTQLLGADWRKAKKQIVAHTRQFTGTVLASVPVGKKQAVIAFESRRKTELESLTVALGRGLTPEEEMQQRIITRKELARLLTPNQLEEYLLRHSSTADEMRDQLRGFGATSEEFRAIFRTRDTLDLETIPIAEIEETRESDLQKTLGPERYLLYQRTKDPLFREAQKTVEQAGVSLDLIPAFYAIGQLIQEERERIKKDNSLDETSRRKELEEMVQKEQEARTRILEAAKQTK